MKEKKETVLQELFGSMKFRKPIKEIIRETRKELIAGKCGFTDLPKMDFERNA